MSGEVGRVWGAGAQHVANTHGVDILRLEANALHGAIGGQHLEVHGAVAFQRTSKCPEWSSLGCHNKDPSGQDVPDGHDADISSLSEMTTLPYSLQQTEKYHEERVDKPDPFY